MNPELSPELKAMLSNCKKCKEYTRKEVVEEISNIVRNSCWTEQGKDERKSVCLMRADDLLAKLDQLKKG